MADILMDRRLSLHSILVDILGTKHVYFQPPSSIKMAYPAIVYELNNMYGKHADNTKYTIHQSYKITLIDSDPDSVYREKLLTLPLCSFNTSYASDNLNHYVFTITY